MDESQRTLVKRIQSGDKSAETDLFAKYKDAILWKVCRHIQSSLDDIKDVVSEVYLAILEGLRKKDFKQEKWPSLDAYIRGVTNNKVRDWFSDNKRKRSLFLSGELSEEIASYTEDYLLERAELEKLLKEVLGTLAPKYRKALELHFLKEYSIQEMSKKLKMPPRRVSERIHYALKLIRKACERAKIVSIIKGS